MDNKERFFAGETFEIQKAYGYYKVESDSEDEFSIKEKDNEDRWQYHSNITGITTDKCMAYSLFFNKLVEEVLVFDELIFVCQEGGKDDD